MSLITLACFVALIALFGFILYIESRFDSKN